MGRIKTKLIKRITKKLVTQFGGEFAPDFSKNKLAVSGFTDVSSKKLRNVIAGYATRLIKFRMSDKAGQRRFMKEEDFSKYYN